MELRFVPPQLASLDELDAEVLACPVWSDARPVHGLAGLCDWRLAGRISDLERKSLVTGALGEVVLLPGKGHDRHNHEGAEEVLYVLSGEGVQTVNDGEPFPVRAGDAIYIPEGAFHSTVNIGWEPMRLIALYNPGGAELGLRTLPDFREIPAGEAPPLERPEN